jgi:hypothetical protein
VRRVAAAVAAGAALALASSCAEPSARPRGGPAPAASAAPEAGPEPALSASAPPESLFGRPKRSHAQRALENERLVAEALAEASALRGLPVRSPVKSRTLTRDELLAIMLKEQEQGAPKEVMELTGESLVALELAPAAYDFIEGVFALLKEQIAGLYDPDTQTMFLLDDLSASTTRQTLAHELVHALQDQSFSLKGALDWKARESDKTAAFQTLVEGDATAAMFAVATGGAGEVDEAAMRRIVSVGVTLSAPDTPPVLVRSLVAPYTDGFAFVQALRRKGGWAEVDRALARRPISTEQILHPAKYFSGEKPVALPDPPIAALGEGFRYGLVDSMGEQGARIAFEDWTHRARAVRVAEGWGGDVFAVATRSRPGKGREAAVLWHLRADSAADAREIAELLEERFGKACAERADRGPVAWIAKGLDVVVAAGPFERRADRSIASAGDCSVTTSWAKAALDAAPPAPAGKRAR